MEILQKLSDAGTVYNFDTIDVDGKPEVQFKCLKRLVGERGFEPPTPWSRTRCSTRLSHSPTEVSVEILLQFATQCPIPFRAKMLQCSFGATSLRSRFSPACLIHLSRYTDGRLIERNMIVLCANRLYTPREE